MSNNRLCLVHGGGVTTISPDFGLEHVLNLSSECSRVDTAAVDDSGTGIYFLSGTPFHAETAGKAPRSQLSVDKRQAFKTTLSLLYKVLV